MKRLYAEHRCWMFVCRNFQNCEIEMCDKEPIYLNRMFKNVCYFNYFYYLEMPMFIYIR